MIRSATLALRALLARCFINKPSTDKGSERLFWTSFFALIWRRTLVERARKFVPRRKPLIPHSLRAKKHHPVRQSLYVPLPVFFPSDMCFLPTRQLNFGVLGGFVGHIDVSAGVGWGTLWNFCCLAAESWGPLGKSGVLCVQIHHSENTLSKKAVLACYM